MSLELTPFTPLKILRHADRIDAMLKGQRVYPVSVEIDLANVCNHQCPWCSFNGFRQDNWVRFPTPRIFTLLDELRAVGVKSITFTGGGEPLVHAQAAEIFLHAHNLGLEFGLVTNGRRLEGRVLDALRPAKFVRVSLDAGTEQTHQLLHATATPEFHRILGNLAMLRAAAPATTIGASFCVFDANLFEIGLAASHVKANGGNYLEVRPVFPTEWRGGGFSSPLTADHVDDARRSLDDAKATYDGDGFRVLGMIHRFDQVFDPRKPYTKCQIGPLTTVINADGFIYHCCQQRGMPNFRAGSVFTLPFEAAWFNAEHQRMVAAIDIAKCPPCRYDGFNAIIEHGFEGDALHANFI